MRYRKLPVSFTASRDVIQFLNGMNKGRKSEFINHTLKKEIAKRKNPRAYIKELQKERLARVGEIGIMAEKISQIGKEYGISEDEIGQLQDIAYHEFELTKKDSVQEKQTQLIENAN